MEQYLPLIVEIILLLVLWFLTLGLTRPLLRSQGDSGLKPTGVGSLLRYICRPFVVVLLTQAFLMATAHVDLVTDYLAANPEHVNAWELFWAGVFVMLLFEGLAHMAYHRRGRQFPVPDLLLDILRLILVLLLAFAVLKLQLGINIAPLLASTALLTAVIGFALQGVLGNLLAGMSIHISRSVMPGDWVTVGEVEGKVMQTNWRETRIRTMGGHVYIVPNSRIADSNVHNIVRPTPVRRHRIDVGASYSDSPDEVIAALTEAARENPDVLPNPTPDAYVTEFQDYGINYALRFWTKDYHRRLQVDGDVNRMIWYKFKRRGIEIPFPMSDKLLNDFMAVVYNQRKLDPTDKQTAVVTEDLLNSDLVQKMVVDSDGAPLLTRDDMAGMAAFVRHVPFTHGETLFHQGDEGDTCYILVSGALNGNVKDGTGSVVAEFELEPGVVVGEMSLLFNAPRSAEVNVTGSSVLLEIGPEAFAKLLSLRPEIPEIFAELAATRAEANKAALEAWAAQTPDVSAGDLTKERLLSRFLKLVRR